MHRSRAARAPRVRLVRLDALVVVLAACALGACDSEPAATTEIPALAREMGPSAEAAQKLRKAGLLLEADASREAEPLLRRVLELQPGRADARALLVELLLDERRYEEAVPLLEATLVDDPKDAVAHQRLANTYHELGRVEQAEAAYEAWLELDVSPDEALFGWGQLLYQEGRYDEARRAFGRAERLKAGRADLRSELGLVLQALGRLEQAETKQRDALERDPRSAEAWFRLGDVISKQNDGRRDEAVDAMRQAVRLDRGHIHAQLYLYRLLKLMEAEGDAGVANEASRRWRAVLALHGPRQLGPRTAVPRAPKGGGRSEDELDRALEADPGDIAARRELAEWLHREGHFDEAVTEYERLLDGGAGDTALLVQAGTAHLLEGRPARAAQLLERAETAADCPAGGARLLAWALLLDDRPELARAAALRELERDAGDLPARRVAALARMRAGELDEGLQEIAAAGYLY